jgi:hypothetical protein
MADAPFIWRETTGMSGPVFLCCSNETAELLLAAAMEPASVLRIAPPDFGARVHIWKRLLPEHWGIDDADVDALSSRFRFGPRRMAQALARVEASLALDSGPEHRPGRIKLIAACREVGAAGMSDLAEALPLPYVMTDLIVRDELRRELELSVAWMTHRRQVLEDWAFKSRVAQAGGLTALFSGPPGTGKTMGAQVLARSLQVMLYRVDLSRVLSKWIGETERNLGRLFDEAQASGCALFFDEADALFGKRSDVRDAHDRYANVEIGYLLQRMDQYDGVTILATNRPGDLDEAFLRRFHVIARFEMPDASERARIWRGIFPSEAALAEDVDLGAVAHAFDLSGGEIRNAALAAAFLAAADGSPIMRRHVVGAALREMRKAGRVVADELTRQL